MARRVEYLCDECDTSFGERTHINIKNGDVRLSYKNQVGSWSQAKIKAVCKEYHFCNVTCLTNWLGKQIQAIELLPKPDKSIII